MLDDTFRTEMLASFVSCVTERVFVYAALMFEGDVRMVSVQSEFINRGFCPGLDDYGGGLNVLRA